MKLGENWRERAACEAYPLPQDAHYWFPVADKGNYIDPEARAICLGCPVRQQCLEFGLNTSGAHDGAMTDAERRKYGRAHGWPVGRRRPVS